MKRKDIERIIAGVSVLTLGITPPIMTMAENKPFVIELEKKELPPIEMKTTSEKYNEFVKQTEKFLAEKEEAERLRLEEEARIKAEEERLAEERRVAEIIRKNSVGVNLDNVLEPSNITPEELYQVFIEMGKEEMSNLAWAITDAEYYTGINSLFLASLIAHESAYNTSYRATYQNNVTGFAVYNSGAEGSYFVDKYSCIIQTAEWLKNEYLSPSGRYFNGYTTYHVNIKYCLNEAGTETDFNWSTTINNIAKTIESYYHKFVKEI